MIEWWESIQPEWRRFKQDPQSPDQWSYILSGGSKGTFIMVLCLAWWDRAYARYLEKQKESRRVEAEAAGVTASFNDLPDHDAEWLSVVDDIAFVMRKAQDCDLPVRGMPSPSRTGKRKRQDPTTLQNEPAAKGTSRKGSKKLGMVR